MENTWNHTKKRDKIKGWKLNQESHRVMQKEIEDKEEGINWREKNKSEND